ncbi:ion transporter [Halomonas elongata]|uniref:Ion channel domain protein n=1 Tax=Halomonas elongata (strain ATCC 33173 / DSM 2581 / NBRC 15536 / NCIMB 2198 / 1H9) TaxID=768066 RepID=E1V844_HALED|nr:ion transporter [Halomonas elongata]MBW5801424.1 ion transporter [Halomonas elongata]WBF18845.1 ion transporter [Halomonas elongata]WPU47703.1 ion transporter [Halomonas elongata DSM 2581]WVI72349.1 ion transporter [Halomonas elongata]CBV41607.1 ion channel domain protein [Halomonas elongata DSM 2581]
MNTQLLTWRDRFERIRANKIFETVVIAIIIVSALLIGAKTYEETSRFHYWLLALDMAVTVFFLVEILIRMAAEKRLRDFFKQGWNVFDFLIVTASLIPVGESDMVLLARLLRIFRVLRLVSMIPELRMLMAALVKSIPRMGYVALLMFIIFYIYAAIGSFLFADVDDYLWGNIAVAMLTLFRIATFEDWTDIMYATQEDFSWSWLYYLTFIFLTAFIFLNMMIGIVLDVMQKESMAIELESGEGEAAEIQGLRGDVRELREQVTRLESLLIQQNEASSSRRLTDES